VRDSLEINDVRCPYTSEKFKEIEGEIKAAPSVGLQVVGYIE